MRLESYMFTTESFRAVRDHLKPDGLLVVYNYFREQWLVDRLANTAAAAFGAGAARARARGARLPRRHAGGPAAGDADVGAGRPGPRHGVQPVARAGAGAHATSAIRDRAGQRRLAVPLPARRGTSRSHYSITLALVLIVSAVAVLWTTRGQGGRWSWQFFLLGAGFMLLETKVDHPVRAAVGLDVGGRLAGDCVGADHGADRELHRSRDRDHGGRGWWAACWSRCWSRTT